jgi:hypothetical protein
MVRPRTPSPDKLVPLIDGFFRLRFLPVRLSIYCSNYARVGIRSKPSFVPTAARRKSLGSQGQSAATISLLSHGTTAMSRMLETITESHERPS